MNITASLLVLFVALKLMGYITWSWLWVLAPFWIPFVIVAVCLVLIAIVKAWLR